VRLKIVIQEKRRPDTQFSPADVLKSLDFTLIYEDEMDREVLRKQLAEFKPDLIYIVGWRAKLSRFMASDKAFRQIPKVLIFDLPFAWTLKKLIAPVVLRGYFKRFKACFVPGARASEYARWLGFNNEQIKTGLFSIRIQKNEEECGSRKNFLFVGRYVKEKRLDVLVKAYARYRVLVAARNEEPWGLSCCGMGPTQHYIREVEGIVDHGFCQPEQVASMRLSHGALVLASEFDPWPLVIAEACAAGLPVICTEACGSHVELIRGNGIVCKTHDVEALAQAMFKIYLMSDLERLALGQEGRYLVKAYSCEAWSERVIATTKWSQWSG
jgi:glycosyltransferase involved in cell wall biosynthesis